MTAPTDPPDTLLILRPVRDPLARPGYPARDPDYRMKLLLKRLLRDFGFRCVRVCDVPTGTRPADVRAGTGDGDGNGPAADRGRPSLQSPASGSRVLPAVFGFSPQRERSKS